ncbi:Putative metal-dependent hydrolase YfiT [Polystyrenella longa]|uniref:Metal-dependent hydrolase YfiT n=1 Tax=Polystyrenella longa TaxID=2528007 RepID=A0A518CIM9_9PLAN|nr:DinB family protein [Polystyrenella longa]QDU79089.1 Putative metal-dependent hydrolase YfiT [Polystyrenella longa]
MDDQQTKELIDTYAAGPQLLKTAVEGMTASDLKARPIENQWSTLGVVCHIADFEIVYADRIKRILAEDKPTFFGGEPDEFAAALAYDQRDLATELALIESIRAHLVVILSQLDPEQFMRTGLHSEAGEMTLKQLLINITAHVPHHVGKIKEKRTRLGQ